MKIRKILYPTDFSPCARQAFASACSLARLYGAELHVLHALVLYAQEPYDPMFYLPASEDAYNAAAAAADVELGALASSKEATGLPVVIAQRRDFQPGPAILDYAASEAVDLIVIGTHGRRGPARLLLGSVAEEVVRRAGCPVLCIRQPDNGVAAPAGEVHGILAPVDFSPGSRQALLAAADVSRRHGALLTLLHVVEEPMWSDVYGVAGALQVAEQREQALAAAAVRLRDLANSLAPVPCQVEVRTGRPATEIVAYSARPEVDLVVMSSRGLTGIKRLLFGSTAEEVLRLAAAPVMVVKPVEEPQEPALAGKALESTPVGVGKE
jgi:nucleotide-binding universal stress UspA family protein